jgi:hypothetical protein
MSEVPLRLCAASLSFALVAIFHTFIPTQAEAATGLFAVRRTFHSDQVGQGNRTRTASIPTASGYVGTSLLPKFTVPQSVIKDTTGYAACVPGICRVGYPESKAWYSYWNLRGSFRPNNPYGATMTTTVRFNTTMGNTGPPIATGEPVTPTTTFDGRYDFRRHGSIMITPGPNRFGGTMQFFYGPNQRYYQFVTVRSVYASKANGVGQPSISTYHESQVGEFVIGRQMDRYRLTSLYYSKATTGAGSFIESTVQYVSTIVPFTTGMITGYQPVGRTTTLHTLTGYDNRTPAGLNGVISLVRPRLVHAYLKTFDPTEPIFMVWASARAWQIDFQFLPEPGGTTLLAAGVVALAGLYRRRRHSVER